MVAGAFPGSGCFFQGPPIPPSALSRLSCGLQYALERTDRALAVFIRQKLKKMSQDSWLKSQIPNPEQYQNSNVRNPKQAKTQDNGTNHASFEQSSFGHSSLFRISIFDIRIS
jgi:hypothetical protein